MDATVNDIIAKLAATATAQPAPPQAVPVAQMDADARAHLLTDDELASLTSAEGSDLNRAEFAAERVQGRLIHVAGPGWYVWTGTHWAHDNTTSGAQAREMIQDVSRELVTLSLNSRNALAEQAAKAMRSSRNITNIMTELKSMRGIRRDVTELDQDPWALNAANGTIDLRTGNRRDHNPDDMISYVLDYEYHSHADATRWTDFVNSCHPDDPEMVEFLQRLAGYGATGSTREEVFAYFHGEGSNGKTVFMETLGHVLAPVVTSQNASFWQTTRQERNGALIAKLHGARLVLSSEMANTRLDETFVKAVVSGDMLTANKKYAQPYDFNPTGLVIMAGNARPVIQGTDAGIWRRTRFVPWNESFTGERKDDTLKTDLQRPEHAEGVLRYIVEGAVRWYQEGLNSPSAVTEATEELREDLNPFTEWIDSAFTTGPDAFVSNTEIQKRGKTAGQLPGHPTSWPARVAEHFGAKVTRKRVDGKQVKGIPGVCLAEAVRIYETDTSAVFRG